ncbi:Vps62-related protein [Mechercharimyces sp. CAU 1602]|uniref:Vps62-related protein n=1 Tax=Mechercharimyces sp. CAU 1602 TaxID=2973933 RepID=UPI002162A25F|nr:Vps62-related protein [Mechercharimyces sp. CAU 1602]MCS1349974.1 Vps62-related protein [Mechercharimyces sp. CAU 1602]
MKKVIIFLSFLIMWSMVLPLQSAGAAGGEYTDAEKRQLIQSYSPLIWFDKGEDYYPSSVEWSFKHMERYIPQGKEVYSIKTKENFCDDCTIPFFRGDLESAKIYAFWSNVSENVNDISYYVWYPYNRGKTLDQLSGIKRIPLLGKLVPDYGHHVGDWEKVIVRLEDGKMTRMQYNYHSWNKIYKKDQIQFYEGHPVVYVAKGSHGSWPSAGKHVYYKVKKWGITWATLSDYTSKGVQWETWKSIEAYDKDQQRALLGSNSWPAWMSSDTASTLPGMDASDPHSGGIDRWGNQSGDKDITGQSKLSGGPSGPDENTKMHMSGE